MEEQRKNEFPRPQETPDWAQETLAPAKPPFSASRKEVLLAFGMYVLAYVYLGSGWWALPLFAAGFLLYAVFNAVFLPSFYANGYKVGVAFVKAIIPTTLAMIVFEALPHVPGLMWLDDMDAATQVRLLPYFVAAVLLYGIGTVLTFRRAAAQYEKVDL